MTPDERQMITDLFERMRSFGPVDKDREADALIQQATRATPDAAYKLVQSVLVQENALQEAGNRIQDLEAQVAELQAAMAAPARQSSGGSFLGGLFGGNKAAAPAQSVPVSGRSAGFGQAPQQAAGSPWGQRQAPAGGGYAPQPQGYAQQPPMQQQAAGGGFMRSAMTTAAGVAGGMLAAGAIRDMMGGGSAHASGHRNNEQTAEASPYAVNQDQPAAEPAQDYTYQSEETNDPGNADFSDAGGGSDSIDT